MNSCRIYVFKSLLRSIKCMPLHFCDFKTTSMYLHKKRVCAIITLRRISKIVYVQNFISSPVIERMIHLIFLHYPLFTYKMQFVSLKTASNIFMMASYCKCIAIIYLLKTYRGGFSER